MNHSFFIDGRTRLAGLLGSPVAHSLSPAMHNTAFQLLGLNCVYLCFDVPEDDLPAAVEGLRRLHVLGFNLTMPDKNRMAALTDRLSPAAALIGAVNTVVNEDGTLTGHNTDGAGFLRSAAEAGWTASGQTLTILGAGGAASAIAAQAALDGASSLVIAARPASRFHARTEVLVRNICDNTACRASLIDLEDTAALGDAISASSLLVNATPVGMEPDTEQSLIRDMSLFHEGLTVSDIIYSPARTKLLRQAAEAGCTTFNGMYMLLYQGAEAFRLWTGRDMPVEEIRQRYFSAKR